MWAKLPGHPFWPGLRVDLDRDAVPPETLAMRKENEALVIFFGENSFGWVREDQVLDFKEAYAEKAREPIRNKARFNSALQEALNDVERRDGGFVPPAVQQRGKSGGHANGGGKTSGEDEKKAKTGDVVVGGAPPAGMDPSANDAGEVMKAMAAAASAAVASGRTTTEGCACRVCAAMAKGSPKSGKGAVCLRIEAQRAAAKHPVGAMLALQGAASVGHNIEIYWPLDHVHYTARVTSYDPVELQHMVMYEADGVREFLCLWNEDVKVLDGPTPGEGPAPSAPRDHGEKPGAAAAHAAEGVGGGGRGAEAEAKAEAATNAAKQEPMWSKKPPTRRTRRLSGGCGRRAAHGSAVRDGERGGGGELEGVDRPIARVTTTTSAGAEHRTLRNDTSVVLGTSTRLTSNAPTVERLAFGASIFCWFEK